MLNTLALLKATVHFECKRVRARYARVGHASVPVGFDVGEGGEDDDVVF